MAEIPENELIKWLWDHKIDLGSITIFAGDPQCGMSMMARYINEQVNEMKGQNDGRDSRG